MAVTTTALPIEAHELESLLALADPQNPLIWLRHGEGMIGLGEALRLSFEGPERFADAASAWRAVVGQAEIDDRVGVPGTGLVAFGSFAFAAGSAAASTLLVPRTIVGHRDGVSWLTRIALRDELGSDPAETPTPHEDGPAYPLEFIRGTLDAAGYARAVRAAVGRIEAGDVGKVVLARDIFAPIPADADLRHPLRRLATSYPDTWTFALDGLIGSSPETLVRVDHKAVSARVLAGSTGRRTDAAADRRAAEELADSEKNQQEHGFAVRSILESLGRHTSALTVSDPFTLRLPNIWHLASDLDGILADGSSSLDLLGALHPTAAVAGTPTPAALDLIDELEPFDRGVYAGPVGWVDARGDGEWAIALRCGVVADGRVTAYAGCGIVAGSEPQRELAETRLKFRPIVDAFA
ncbi:isochorismate synthase [Naasia lichenicola]|uniref:isochorismate synthase n=1 Tax=Naasia lichenicola TaxID=2565933 RepID=A0A4S4FLS1_9MICO|nr:isochorismate synthase [Naasia lichenicola]